MLNNERLTNATTGRTRMKTIKEALDLPFEDYIEHCWNFMRDRRENDPVIKMMWPLLTRDGGVEFLEAQWAKRYWYHKNGVQT